jgi:uncharacterized protein involved in exopolysaccharide biosynthesis
MTMAGRGVDELQNGSEDDDEGGLDLEGVKERLGFVLRSPRRHPLLAAGAFLVVSSLGLTVAITMPRVYNSTARLLEQKTAMLPALGNPNLPLRESDFEPTKDVGDVIRRRENVIELVKDSNLVERFYATRSSALLFKDKVFATIFGPMKDEDKVHAVVGILEKKLDINSDANSVTISVDWPEPNAAYTIVNLVQKNLIDAKYDSEVAMIEDTIALLEDHGKDELDQLDSALADLQGLQGGVARSAPSDAPAPAPVAVRTGAPPVAAPRRAAAAPDADLAEALLEKRQQIKTYEEDHRRTLEGLKQQLVQAQLTLTAMHPTVVALQQRVDEFSQPSPELARLKSEERAIVMQIAPVVESGGGAAGAPAGPRVGSPTAGAPGATAQGGGGSEREDPSLAAPRERLARAISRYQDVMAHIDSAKLQLDISRTAYRYRYRVITPAEVAGAPKKPIAPLIGIVSVLGALLVGLLAAAFADWSRGVILETWQVRRVLKLDVLSELDPPL